MKTLHVVIIAVAVVATSALYSRPGAQIREVRSHISAAGKDAAWVVIGDTVWYCTTIQNKCEALDLLD